MIAIRSYCYSLFLTILIFGGCEDSPKQEAKFSENSNESNLSFEEEDTTHNEVFMLNFPPIEPSISMLNRIILNKNCDSLNSLVTKRLFVDGDFFDFQNMEKKIHSLICTENSFFNFSNSNFIYELFEFDISTLGGPEDWANNGFTYNCTIQRGDGTESSLIFFWGYYFPQKEWKLFGYAMAG